MKRALKVSSITYHHINNFTGEFPFGTPKMKKSAVYSKEKRIASLAALARRSRQMNGHDGDGSHSPGKIPHIIHQIWFQGSEHVPMKYAIFRQTWDDGDFQNIFWDETKIADLMEQVPSTWKCIYTSFPTMIQKIDFAKYVILYVYGGIYIDMDVFAVNSLKEFMNGKHTRDLDFIVFQHNTPCITITMNKMMGLEGSRIINNAVIFSAPRNEKMKSIISACCSAQNGWRKNLLSLQLRCLVTTGPVVFTNCIRRFPDWKLFTFPAQVFEPYTTLEMASLSTSFSSEQNSGSSLESLSSLSNDHEAYVHLMSFLKRNKNMSNVVGIHVLDLNWFKNGKDNWKFRAYRTLQRVKKNIVSVGTTSRVSI